MRGDEKTNFPLETRRDRRDGMPWSRNHLLGPLTDLLGQLLSDPRAYLPFEAFEVLMDALMETSKVHAMSMDESAHWCSLSRRADDKVSINGPRVGSGGIATSIVTLFFLHISFCREL